MDDATQALSKKSYWGVFDNCIPVFEQSSFPQGRQSIFICPATFNNLHQCKSHINTSKIRYFPILHVSLVQKTKHRNLQNLQLRKQTTNLVLI